MASRAMLKNYGRPSYSEETLKRWTEQQKKDREFAERHSQETTKDYEVKDFIVRCIQRKYDACMKKENEYGIQIWMQKPEETTAESCFYNEWFNNVEQANEEFKRVKEML